MSRLQKLAAKNNVVKEEVKKEEVDVMQNIADFFGDDDVVYFGGSDWNFAKLDANRTTLRLLGTPTEAPFQRVSMHKYYLEGSFTATMDLELILRDEDIRNWLIESNKITPTELRIVQEQGDPFNRVAKALSAANDDRRRNFFPNNSYFWNVIKRPEEDVAILETSSSFYKQVKNLLQEGMNFFTEDYDLVVVGNGKDKQERRYESYMAVPRKYDDPEELELYDLMDVAMNLKYVSPQTKAEHLFQAHGSLAESFGLSGDLWIPDDLDDDIPFGK